MLLYVYLFVSDQVVHTTQYTHTQTIILLDLKNFQYDLKCNTFIHGKLPHRGKSLTIHTCHCSWEIRWALKCET